MTELDQSSFVYKLLRQEASVGQLFRLTQPEALEDGYRWIFSAHKNPAAPVELLDDRHEVGKFETANIGTRILLFRAN